MDFLEALAGAASTSVWGPAGTADQMILALDAAIEAEERECPFAVGDFVTPRGDAGRRGAGARGKWLKCSRPEGTTAWAAGNREPFRTWGSPSALTGNSCFTWITPTTSSLSTRRKSGHNALVPGSSARRGHRQ